MAPQSWNEQALEQLARVHSSSGFVRNERMSRFLRFLVEQHLHGRDDDIKESVIAIEVFNRKPDYDPRQDSIVRTEAGRLRARLAEYYIGAGRTDPIIIELPKGGYIPTLRRAPEPAPVDRPIHFGRRWRRWALAGVVLVAVSAGWWSARRESPPIPIAVLPLDSLSHDSADIYFADGLTDEIIRNLSIIEGLAVRSQTSSFAVQRQPQNLRETGRQLAVDYILEGSVLRSGQRLRVNVQLVRVRDDVPAWSSTFERGVTDVFAIQDDISRSIVNYLRLRLGGGRRRYETSLEAYDFYLQGRALPLRRGMMGRLQSIGLFEQAVAKDASFAPAYAGLGAAYAIRSIQFPVDHPADELEKMRAAAEKAVQLDPLLPEAHAALALAYARDSRWGEAEQSFRRAIELDPNRSSTYTDFALWLLYVLGRNEEALGQLRIAQRTDPLSPDVHLALAMTLTSTGRFEQAAAECLKMPMEDTLRKQCLAQARLGEGHIDEAIQLLTNDPNPQSLGFLGYAYARSGRREEAEKLLAGDSPPANEQALIFAGLGDKRGTLEALNRMAALGAQRVGMYLNFFELASLQGDPALAVLRKKVGLPD